LSTLDDGTPVAVMFTSTIMGEGGLRPISTKETSPTGVLVGYIQSDGSIYMFDQTLNGAQTVHILIYESQDLTIQTLSSRLVTSS